MVIIDYSFIIDNMTFSFSRLNSFLQCPYQFKLQYINEIKGVQNFFAEYGSYCHSILEKYSKNELSMFELASEYEKNYWQSINFKAPPNKYVDLNQSYYEQGLDYFENFMGFESYEILEVEKEVNFKIDKYKFTGYIDLLLKDKNENLHVVDHKSSDPKSKNSEKAQEYFKQMYFYSIPIFEEYGKYPVQLHINAFRKQQWFTEDFDINKVEEVKNWALETINKIKMETKFLPKSDHYFCSFLCNFRNGICEYIPQGD
jgi:RecB family exonuclease